MKPKTRGAVAVIIGLFAGAFASQEVPWNPIPKALLAAAVAAIVTGILFLILPKSKTK